MKKLLVILSVLLSGCTGWFPTPNIYSGTVGWNPPQLSMAEGCPDLSGRYVDPRGNFFTYFLIGDDLNFYAKNIAPLFPEG